MINVHIHTCLQLTEYKERCEWALEVKRSPQVVIDCLALREHVADVTHPFNKKQNAFFKLNLSHKALILMVSLLDVLLHAMAEIVLTDRH